MTNQGAGNLWLRSLPIILSVNSTFVTYSQSTCFTPGPVDPNGCDTSALCKADNQS
jgi:hypothetical protein